MVNDAILRSPVKENQVSRFRDTRISSQDPLSLCLEVVDESSTRYLRLLKGTGGVLSSLFDAPRNKCRTPRVACPESCITTVQTATIPQLFSGNFNDFRVPIGRPYPVLIDANDVRLIVISIAGGAAGEAYCKLYPLCDVVRRVSPKKFREKACRLVNDIRVDG